MRTVNTIQGEFVRERSPEFVKSLRPQQTRYFDYPARDGAPLVRAVRIDLGNGEKKNWSEYWNGSKWLKGCPPTIRQHIPIYRYAEVRAAYDRGEHVFIVEGEPAVDALWNFGIPATTTIGGCGGYGNYGNYRSDLAGVQLVLAPDRDKKGLAYIANFERDFPNQIAGYYLAGTARLWRQPEGGMDIFDDILDRNYTQVEIIARVIDVEEYQNCLQSASQTESPPDAAIENVAAQQPEQAAIYIKDELKAIFSSANAHRGGKGDDTEKYLSYYDGQKLSRERAGSGFTYSNHDIRFATIGTIQPAVLQELVGKGTDDNGLMSRFLYAKLNYTFTPMIDDGEIDVSELLAGIYRQVNGFTPTTYKLTSAAFKVFAQAFDSYGRNAIDPAKGSWEQNTWAKAGGQLARLCLNLHLAWGCIDGRVDEFIEPEIVSRAVRLAECNLSISLIGNCRFLVSISLTPAQ
jgi:hypothetical protein